MQSQTMIIKTADLGQSISAYWQSKKDMGLTNLLAPSVIGQGVNIILGTTWLGWAIDLFLRLIGVDFSALLSGLSEKVSGLIDRYKDKLSPSSLFSTIKDYIYDFLPDSVKDFFSKEGELDATLVNIKTAYLESPAYQFFKQAGEEKAGLQLFQKAYVSQDHQLKKEALWGWLLSLLGAGVGYKYLGGLWDRVTGGKDADSSKQELATKTDGVLSTAKTFFSNIFSFTISVGLATVGFELFSDFLKGNFADDKSKPSSNIFSNFSLTGLFSNDPNDKIRPKKSAQTKYPKNPSFSDVSVNRVNGSKTWDVIKQTYMDWANEAYLNIDQSKLAGSKDLEYLVNTTYAINSDIWAASFFIVPNSFHSKLQVVDYFIDDVAGHVASTSDLRYSKTNPHPAPPAASAGQTKTEVKPQNASVSTKSDKYPDHNLVIDSYFQEKLNDYDLLKVAKKLKPEQQLKLQQYFVDNLGIGKDKGITDITTEGMKFWAMDAKEKIEYFKDLIRKELGQEALDAVLSAMPEIKK